MSICISFVKILFSALWNTHSAGHYTQPPNFSPWGALRGLWMNEVAEALHSRGNPGGQHGCALLDPPGLYLTPPSPGSAPTKDSTRGQCSYRVIVPPSWLIGPGLGRWGRRGPGTSINWPAANQILDWALFSWNAFLSFKSVLPRSVAHKLLPIHQEISIEIERKSLEIFLAILTVGYWI